MTEKQCFKSYSSRGLWPTKIQLAVLVLIRSTFRAITAITFGLECRFEVLLDGQEQLYRNKRCFQQDNQREDLCLHTKGTYYLANLNEISCDENLSFWNFRTIHIFLHGREESLVSRLLNSLSVHPSTLLNGTYPKFLRSQISLVSIHFSPWRTIFSPAERLG